MGDQSVRLISGAPERGRPRRLGKYQLLKSLAAGGMGEIHAARVAEGPGVGRVVVIKTALKGAGNGLRSHDYFRSEIQIMLGFNHPNIVTMYDVDSVDGVPYIALEWLEGKSVRGILASAPDHRIDPGLALRIGSEVCRGLHYAHTFSDRFSGRKTPVIHRDVSPSNILVTLNGAVKLIDFGISKVVSETVTEGDRAIVGTMHYLSPEVCMGERIGPDSDVFSLGVVLWEMITGQFLFVGDNAGAIIWKVTNQAFTIRKPSELVPGTPPEIDDLLLMALRRKREGRFRTAAEFGDAIHAVLARYYSSSGEAALSRFVGELFGPAITAERAEISELIRASAGISEMTFAPEENVAEFEPCDPDPTANGTPKIELERRPVIPAFEMPKLRSSTQFSRVEMRRYRVRLLAGLAVLLLSFEIYSHQILTTLMQGQLPVQAVISNSCGLNYVQNQSLFSSLWQCFRHLAGD